MVTGRYVGFGLKVDRFRVVVCPLCGRCWLWGRGSGTNPRVDLQPELRCIGR